MAKTLPNTYTTFEVPNFVPRGSYYLNVGFFGLASLTTNPPPTFQNNDCNSRLIANHHYNNGNNIAKESWETSDSRCMRMHAVVVYHTNSNNEHIQSHYSKITITFQAQHDTKQHAAAMTIITWNTLVQTIQRRLYCTSDPTTTAVNTSLHGHKMAKNNRKTATRLLQNDAYSQDETDASLYTEMLEMETTMTDGSTTEDGSSALFSSWTRSTLLYHDNDNDNDDDTATTSLFASTPRERYRHRYLLQRQPKQQPLTAIATVPSLCFSPTAKISNLSKKHPTFFTKRLPSENDNDDDDNDNESMDSSSTTTTTEQVVVFEYPSDDGSDSDSDSSSSSSASDSSSENNNNNDASTTCSFTHSSSTTSRHSHTTTSTTTTTASTGDDDIPSLLLQRPYSLKRPAQSMHTRRVMADSNHHHHHNNNNRSRRKRRSLRLQIL
jgi:hypothetical protein